MNEELLSIMKRLRELHENDEKQVENVIDALYWEFDVASKCLIQGTQKSGCRLSVKPSPNVTMRKFECLVKRDRITEKIIRWFKSEEYAFAWLELEGYLVFYVKELSE